MLRAGRAAASVAEAENRLELLNFEPEVFHEFRVDWEKVKHPGMSGDSQL